MSKKRDSLYAFAIRGKHRILGDCGLVLNIGVFLCAAQTHYVWFMNALTSIRWQVKSHIYE